ncbi:MAG: hypothetical protein ACTSVK_05295 [Promethearchaeota archaeon]
MKNYWKITIGIFVVVVVVFVGMAIYSQFSFRTVVIDDNKIIP